MSQFSAIGFLSNGVRDLIEEVQSTCESDAVESEAPPSRSAGTPAGAKSKILCITAREQADELATLMLTQILRTRGYSCEILPPESLAGEALAAIEKGEDHIYILSGLSTYAVSQFPYILKKLGSRLASLNVLVTIWGVTGSQEHLKERIGQADSFSLATSIENALEKIQQLNASARFRPAVGFSANS